MIDEERKFLDGLFKYGESCGLDRKETYRVISKVAQNSEPQESDRWKKGKHPLMVCDSEISEETEKRYFEFHEHLVNEILGFINENPEILEVYKKVKSTRETKLNFSPSLDSFISLSDIEESLKRKEWVSSLDSSFAIICGGQTIMESL